MFYYIIYLHILKNCCIFALTKTYTEYTINIMVKIKDLLPSVKVCDFHFLNQRTVKLATIYNDSAVIHLLSKVDVIDCINYYIDRIKVYFDVDVRCSHMNYRAFKMHDLVPFLYTLVNFYLSLYNNSGVTYERYLPELKLTRFCHFPFEEEILPLVKQDLVVMCSLLTDPLTAKSYYMCFVNHFSYHSESVENLLSDIRSCDPSLFKSYNVFLKVVGS